MTRRAWLFGLAGMFMTNEHGRTLHAQPRALRTLTRPPDPPDPRHPYTATTVIDITDSELMDDVHYVHLKEIRDGGPFIGGGVFSADADVPMQQWLVAQRGGRVRLTLERD